jgi:hypothetical protein
MFWSKFFGFLFLIILIFNNISVILGAKERCCTLNGRITHLKYLENIYYKLHGRLGAVSVIF